MEVVGPLTADAMLGGVAGGVVGVALGEEPESEGFSEQQDEEEEDDMVTKVNHQPPSSPGGV